MRLETFRSIDTPLFHSRDLCKLIWSYLYLRTKQMGILPLKGRRVSVHGSSLYVLDSNTLDLYELSGRKQTTHVARIQTGCHSRAHHYSQKYPLHYSPFSDKVLFGTCCGDVWIADRELKSSHLFYEMECPAGITSTPKGEIFIIEHWGAGILVFDQTTNKLVRILELPRPEANCIYDMTWNQGKLYVANFNSHCVQVLSEDGTLLQTFPRFRNATALAVMSGDGRHGERTLLFVVDRTTKLCVLILRDEKMIRVKEMTLAKLGNYADSLCCDSRSLYCIDEERGCKVFSFK